MKATGQASDSQEIRKLKDKIADMERRLVALPKLFDEILFTLECTAELLMVDIRKWRAITKG